MTTKERAVAPRIRNPRHCKRLRAALVTVLVTVPFVSTMAAATAATSEPPPASRPARFSDLSELTPRNVQGLLPLVSRTISLESADRRAPPEDEDAPPQPRSITHRLQVDSSTGVDLRLQRFLESRTHLQLAVEKPEVLALGEAPGEMSYMIETPATAAETAPGALGEHRLRAWDPIERRVVWSVTEALPPSARTLITAGGLVFYGTTDGWLKALDARTGRTLWKYREAGRRLGEPRSYRGIDGHQYIAVHSLPQQAGSGRQTLLIFALAH
jgi:hypothetical protein